LLRRKLLSGGPWPGLLLVAAAICGTGPSQAAETPPQLEYAADSTCPDRNTFADLVEQRVRAAGVEAAFATPQPVKVSLFADSSEFVGTLELERRDGSHYQRTMHGASCAEVADALAFVLALTLTATELPPQEKESPEVASASPVATERLPEPPTEKRRPPWSYGVGAQLGVRAGLAPEWALVWSAFLEAQLASAGPFAFNARLAFLRAPTISHTDSLGTTEFSWWAGRLEGCPLRVPLFAWLAWLPCAGAHVGRLTATGETLSNAGVIYRTSQIWVDGFASSRLELKVASWLSLQAQAELVVPITRYQFAFDNPDTLIYRVPPLAGAAFAGVELRFP
jgi:hypothetical protein